MLSLTKETRLDEVKKTLREFGSYAEQIANDDRLRADVRAAAREGAKAREQVRKDVAAGGIRQLVADKRLRRNLRALLDDLDHASERVRRKKRHRARNDLLMLAGAVAALVAVAKYRLWLSNRGSEGVDSDQAVPLV